MTLASQTLNLLFAHFPLTADGEINRRKLEFIDQASNNFILKAKAVLAGKTVKLIQFWPSAGRNTATGKWGF